MDDDSASLVRRFDIKRIRDGQMERMVDAVASEEPLDIRVSYWFKDVMHTQSLALTMRTPGSDRELAAGLLLSEGVIRSRDDLVDLRALGTEPSNEIVAELARSVDLDAWKLQRNSVVNSSCGVCGKRSRDAIAQPDYPAGDDSLVAEASLVEKLPALLAEKQEAFSKTGGLHAAALVNTKGEVEQVFEDIGRHNALDKLIGSCLLQGGLPLRDRILFLSSRSSFELVQKAVMAGGGMLVTVGAPSSLAIETAREFGVTLVGFARERRFNIYSGEWRIKL
ncbi:MAG: formate dehydrogenase accessory sulfurtransferase FdhD [Bryobacteraceae bacterium]